MKMDELGTHNGGKVVLLSVSPNEALQLIRSLSNQLAEDFANAGRLETYLEDGRDFTIAVDFPIAGKNKS